jgi:hypothetical protein
VDPEEARAMLVCLEEAYRLIGTSQQRRIYDQGRQEGAQHGDAVPAEPAKSVAEAVEPLKTAAPASSSGNASKVEPKAEAASKPEAPPAKAEPPKTEAAEPPKPIRKTEAEIPPDAPVTGEALKKVREAHGLSLKELEGRTKIGHWHLENIEKDRYKDLPALVYLRGFLMSLARELKLDPIRVSRSYLDQMSKSSKPPKSP